MVVLNSLRHNIVFRAFHVPDVDNIREDLISRFQIILGFHMTSSKLKKQGIINPFEILVSLVIRASEDLSFCKFSVS